MKIAGALVCGSVLAVSLPVFAQGPSGPRRDGNWQITVQMEMPGMPAGAGMPPMTMTQCVTPQDAADPAKSIPQQPQGRGGAQNDCKVSDYKTEGNKVSWKMACTTPRPVTGTGEFIYEKDSYTGTMTMDMGGAGAPGGMKMKYTGKRLGDCTK